MNIPFGNRKLTGYVVDLSDIPEYEPEKTKELLSIVEGSIPIEAQMIALAAWMRRNYGGTMNHALKTVIPIKEKKTHKEQKTVRLAVHPMEAKICLASTKGSTAQRAQDFLLRS